MIKNIIYFVSFILLLFIIWGTVNINTFNSFLANLFDSREDEVAVPVQTKAFQKGEISNFIEACATVEARYFVEVYTPLSERVVEISKNEGEAVTKGEVLARLDRGLLELELKEVQSELKQLNTQILQDQLALKEAIEQKKEKEKSRELEIEECRFGVKAASYELKHTEKERRRAQTVFKKGASSAEEYEKSNLRYKEAQTKLATKKFALEKALLTTENYTLAIEKAKVKVELTQDRIAKTKIGLEKASQRLAQTEIKAPISGIISEASIQLGQKFENSIKVFSIINNEELEIKVNIPQRYRPFVKQGQPVHLFTETIPLNANNTFEGVIKEVSPIVQKETGLFKVTIDINKEFISLFPPGMFVSLRLIIDSKPNVYMIPKKERNFEKDRAFIFVLRKHRVAKIFLDAYQPIENKFYYGLSEGIQSNDLLIVEKQINLQEGMLVTPKKESP